MKKFYVLCSHGGKTFYCFAARADELVDAIKDFESRNPGCYAVEFWEADDA